MTAALHNGKVRPSEDQLLAAPLYGRERERAGLCRLLTGERARLITLVGVGGVGKTSLAMQAMRDAATSFRDGVRLVPLASVPDASLVAATVAHAFELGTADARMATEQLQRHLANQNVLLVLDNFEHVTAASDLIVDLLNVAPKLVVLITSRSQLNVWGEQIVEVAPLPVDSLDPDAAPTSIQENPAVRLFLDRAERAGASISESDLPTIAAICRRLEGLPLAVELAAANARTLPLDAFVAPLDQRLKLLAGGPRDLHPRLRTMEASIDWSYELLEPAQQQLFQRLAVFTGGFAIEMAEAMAKGRLAGEGYSWSGIYQALNPNLAWMGFDPTVERLEGVDRSLDWELPLRPIEVDPIFCLRALVDQCLIRLEHGRDGTGRYAMLETIRAFGLERLARSGEEEAVRHAHAVLVCGFADTSLAGLWTGLLRRWELTRIDDELGNIRAALAWATSRGSAAAELAQRIVSGFGLYFQLRGLVSEGIDWFDRALARGLGPDWSRSWAMISLAALCWIQGRDDRAEECLVQATEIARRIGMVLTEAQATFYRSLIAWRSGDYELMKQRVDIAFELFGQCQDMIGIGVCHLTYGVLDRTLGNPASAVSHFEDARVLHDLAAYEWGKATGRYYGGEAARDLGDWKRAATLQREALDLYWKQGDYWGAGACAGGLATLCALRGQNIVAARLFGACEALCVRIGALLPPTELKAYARIANDVRSRLGAPLYELAFEEGRRALPDQCVAMADAAAAGLLGESMEEPWAGEATEATRARAALAGLTAKRREILKLVAQGHEIKEIAHLLGRDYNTIDTQLKAIQKAFQVETKTDLIVHIYRNGLADAL